MKSGLLCIVAYLSTIKAELEPHLTFQGYDCDDPRNVHDLHLTDAHPLCGHNPSIKTRRNVTYSILQLEDYVYFDGWKCTITKAVNARQCGNWDHETRIPQASHGDIPISVGFDVCQRMFADRTYTDETGQVHRIGLNTVNLIKYQLAGSTSVDSKGSEVECIGEDYRHNGKLYQAAVVDVELKIIVVREKLKADTNKDMVYSITEDMMLPCAAEKRQCSLPTAVYIWDYSSKFCPLGKTRKPVFGTEVTNGADTVFISLDGSLVRLILKETVSYCRQIVRTTNYPDIFVISYDDRGQSPFDRIHPAEIEIHTYVNNRDDYLYNHVLDQIETEFQQVLSQDCNTGQSHQRMKYFMQHQNPGLVTYFLGNGTFATPAGEVLYVYQCKPVILKAVETSDCYQSLPVRNIDDPLQKTVYLEPLTHRITHSGIKVPCSRQFLPKYRNLGGGWTMTTPQLAPTARPQELQDTQDYKVIFDRTIDWSKGGLYSEDELKSMREYLEFSRAKEALGAQLVTQSGIYEFNGQVGVHTLFPTTFPNVDVASTFFKKIWDFLHHWGEAAAVFISIFGIFRLLTTLIEILYSFCVLKDTHGWGRHLLWIPFSTLFLLKRYRDNNQENQTGDSSTGSSRTPKDRENDQNQETSEQQPMVNEPPPYNPNSQSESGIYPNVRTTGTRPKIPGSTSLKNLAQKMVGNPTNYEQLPMDVIDKTTEQ